MNCIATVTPSHGPGPVRLHWAESSPEAQPTPIVVTPLIRTMVTFYPDKYKKRKKEDQKEEDK